MSAPNFKSCNTSKYYVFGTSKYYTEEDVKENGLDESLIGEFDELTTEIDYKDAIINCKHALISKGWNEEDECDGNRNYPACVFASKGIDINVEGVQIYATLKAMSVSGYYEGATFDYEAEFDVYDKDDYHVGTYDDEGITEEEIICENWCNNVGLSKIHARRIMQRIEKAVQSLKDEAEGVFSMYCEDECVCAAVFSNGEAIYSKVA